MSAQQIILNNVLSPGFVRMLVAFGKKAWPILALALLGWIIAYGTGLFPYYGAKYRTDMWGGIGNSGYGITVGTSRLPLIAGQTVFIDYDVQEIKKGGLEIWIGRRFAPGQKDSKLKWVRQTGTGRIQKRITKSGLYAINVKGSFAGKGDAYQVRYTAKWGAVFGDLPKLATSKAAPKKKQLKLGALRTN